MGIKKESQEGIVGWESPSNIAIIKYWGKKANQLPCNPSLSMSLKNSFSRTKVSYKPRIGKSLFRFLFEGKRNIIFEKRIQKWFRKLNDHLPYLNEVSLEISSENTFPHSAGIASSASAMSSLALCLCSIEEELSGKQLRAEDFFRKASLIARLGSGSAARSVYGGYVLWGDSESFSKSSNEYAVPFLDEVHPVFHDFQDTILLVSSQKKKVPSSVGHKLMTNHPYAKARFLQANTNFDRLLGVLRSGDLSEFAEIMENEALSMHGLMMNSSPSYTLLKPNTLELVEKIRNFRESSKLPVGFTLDAGPNIHLLYPSSVKKKVVSFIQADLLQYLEHGRYILDERGEGPQKISCTKL